jgi:hypothetical protein
MLAATVAAAALATTIDSTVGTDTAALAVGIIPAFGGCHPIIT